MLGLVSAIEFDMCYMYWRVIKLHLLKVRGSKSLSGLVEINGKTRVRFAINWLKICHRFIEKGLTHICAQNKKTHKPSVNTKHNDEMLLKNSFKKWSQT